MKVLVFTSLYPNNVWPNQGIFVRERMSHVARLEGCEIKVVAPVPYFPPVKLNWRWSYSQVARREIVDGTEVFHPRYFMIPKFGMAAYGWMMFLSVLPAIKRIRRQFDFDLIDAHYVYPDGFAAVLLGRFFGKPVVVSARGSDINLFSEFSLIRRLLKHTLCRANRIIAVSGALKNAMVGLGIAPEKITVVANGVDATKFHPVVKSVARAELGFPLKQKLVLSVGGLTPVKGFDLLIRAFKLVVEGLPGEKPLLVIVGEGHSRRELEQIVSEINLRPYVRLVGAVPHSQLYLWYSAVDLFCLASRCEGWPNVVLESFACGTPVLATSVGGIPEIVVSEAFGILTERDERKIADKIRQALGRKWESQEIVGYARERSWDKTAQSVVYVFKSATAGGVFNAIK